MNAVLKAIALLLLLAGMMVPANGQRRAPAPPPEPLVPAMWEVRRGDSVVTLFGTVHALPRGVDWFRPHVLAALDGSDRLVLESLPPDTVVGTMPTVIRLSRNMKPRPVAERVPESHRAALEEAIARLKAPPMEWYDSWFIALTLSNLQAAENGLDPRIGVEAVLAERAKIRNLPVAALETAEQQLIYFDALSEADQRQLLMATLDDLPESRARTKQLVDDWLAGRTEALAQSINRDFQRSPMLMRMLVNDRNARWAAWIDSELKKPGGKVFLAVGAGHLAGPGSLQDELEKRGLEARRVEPAPPPKPVRRRR